MSRKSRKNIYLKNTTYNSVFDNITAAGGRADAVRQEASDEYYKMIEMHPNLNKVAVVHWKQCCERAALYKTVKRYFPENAFEWVDSAAMEYSRKSGAFINKVLNFPGMANIFLSGMKKMAAKGFGEEAGFRNHFGLFNSSEAHFDILDCPYCRYLDELDCSELKAGFCKSDEYMYGNLDKFAFERTQTLACGGERCDFCIRRR